MKKPLEHGSMWSSSFCEFKFSLTEPKHFFYMVSQPIFTDVHHPLWVVTCFSRGLGVSNGEYVSLFVRLVNNNDLACSTSSSGGQATIGGYTRFAGIVPFLFHAFVAGTDDDADADAVPRGPRSTKPKFFRHIYGRNDHTVSGWRHFVKRSDLESVHPPNGVVTIVCGLLFLPGDDSTITSPPSTMASDLGRMLDCGAGSDISFVVSGETFTAHRAVLAARSPVFRAELFGSMEESIMPLISLQDIEPATFSILLRYMYDDALPPPPPLHDLNATTELFSNVLAAADRYALYRLKLMCAQKMCDILSVDTVAATIERAEMFGCPELKKRCLAFFMEEKNFKKVVVTEGYSQLMQRFPSVMDEIKELIET